jgi:hypothetical protein
MKEWKKKTAIQRRGVDTRKFVTIGTFFWMRVLWVKEKKVIHQETVELVD